MSERSIFDADAISSAIIAYHSCDEHLISDAVKAALRAAEASLIARGVLEYGDHRLRLEGPEVPVAIIKLSEGE